MSEEKIKPRGRNKTEAVFIYVFYVITFAVIVLTFWQNWKEFCP
ncbi:MAG TPA: hypothetical protein PK728_04110 [Bacillota bacterium]|nr:hypothetical protein [Bacillota bacterium]